MSRNVYSEAFRVYLVKLVIRLFFYSKHHSNRNAEMHPLIADIEFAALIQELKLWSKETLLLS